MEAHNRRDCRESHVICSEGRALCSDNAPGLERCGFPIRRAGPAWDLPWMRAVPVLEQRALPRKESIRLREDNLRLLCLQAN
jgi:hypothetical protein